MDHPPAPQRTRRFRDCGFRSPFGSDPHLVAEKNTNETKLQAHLNGDRTQQTRRVDLETKLEEAEKRLADAMAEVARLRKELVSGRGTRRV